MKTQPANKSWAQDSHVRLRLPSDWPDIGQWCSGLCLSGQGSVPVSCVKISHTWMNDYRTYIQKSIHGSWRVQSSHSKDFRMSVSVSYLYQRLINSVHIEEWWNININQSMLNYTTKDFITLAQDVQALDVFSGKSAVSLAYGQNLSSASTTMVFNQIW